MEEKQVLQCMPIELERGKIEGWGIGTIFIDFKIIQGRAKAIKIKEKNKELELKYEHLEIYQIIPMDDIVIIEYYEGKDEYLFIFYKNRWLKIKL